MLPSGQAAVPPAAEDGRAEGQTPALEEGEEAAGEGGAVDVHEVAVAPVVLEVGRAREAELGGLGGAVAVPGAGDAVDDVDVEGEVERRDGVGRGGQGAVGVFAAVVGGGGEEDGQGRGAGGRGDGEVVGEVDEALARHAFPGAVAGDAFGGRAAPEEGAVLVGEGRVRVLFGRVVGDLVDVVPRGGVEDVRVAVDFALGEDGEEPVRGLEGCGAQVEAVEVAEVGLVAGRGGEGPVAEKDAVGVGCGAGCAECATVPCGCLLGERGRRAGYGASGEGVGPGAIFERSCGTQVFWYMPGRSSISAPSMAYRFIKVLGGSGSSASKFLQVLVRDCQPWLIVQVKCHNHVG